jgi:hypothetical protein
VDYNFSQNYADLQIHNTKLESKAHPFLGICNDKENAHSQLYYIWKSDQTILARHISASRVLVCGIMIFDLDK